MKILPFLSLVNIQNQATLNKKSMNVNSPINNTNLITPNSVYNQISFRGINLKDNKVVFSQVLETLQKFVMDEADPFLKKHRHILKRSNALRNKIVEEQAAFFISSGIINKSFEPRDLTILDDMNLRDLKKWFDNKSEFEYLKKRANQYLKKDQAKQLTKEIENSGVMSTPLPHSYTDISKSYQSMLINIQNGLKGIHIDKTSPRLALSRDNLSIAVAKSLLAVEDYNQVLKKTNELKELIKQAKKVLNTHSEKYLDSYYYQITNSNSGNLKQTMNRFESNMERNLLLLKAAKWMLEENTITNRWEITSEFVISRSERNSNKVPQIINRHINKFKKQHQNFTNSKHEQRRLKEIIAEQDTALKTLWQEIQKVKISTQN